MNRIGKLLFLFLASTVMVTLYSMEARAEKKIGVLIYSEEVRYNESYRGIMDQLKKEGFGGPGTSYITENAKSSKLKAVEVVRKFSASKMDLIIAIGTSAALAAVKEINDIPIVFSTVYDPVEAGIANDWKSSGNNTTGASTRFPMSKLMDILKDFAPIQRLAVLYTPGEKNTEAQLKELQKIQDHYQIKVIPIILMKKDEIDKVLPEIARTADAFFLTGSSIIGASVPMIVDIANKAKVVTISHLDDLVEKGALLGVCTNSYQVGSLAGMKAIKILKGVKPSAIPIESGKQIDIILNTKTVKAGQFALSPAFMKRVTRTVE